MGRTPDRIRLQGRRPVRRRGPPRPHRRPGRERDLPQPDLQLRLEPPLPHERLLPGRPAPGRRRGVPAPARRGPRARHPRHHRRSVQPLRARLLAVQPRPGERRRLAVPRLVRPQPGIPRAGRTLRAFGAAGTPSWSSPPWTSGRAGRRRSATWATRRGGTCAGPQAERPQPRGARVPAGRRRSTGSGSGRTAGAWTCPRTSATGTSGASSGAASGPRTPRRTSSPRSGSRSRRSSAATCTTRRWPTASSPRSPRTRAGQHRPGDRVAARMAGGQRRARGRTAFAGRLERLMTAPPRGDGRPVQPARQPRHAPDPVRPRRRSDALRLATLIQATLPGAPAVYYGDEIGMTGSIDPFARAAFPWSRPTPGTRHPGPLRGVPAAPRRAGTARTARSGSRGQGSVVAWLRVLDDRVALVACNNGASPESVRIDARSSRGARSGRAACRGPHARRRGRVRARAHRPARTGRPLAWAPCVCRSPPRPGSGTRSSTRSSPTGSRAAGGSRRPGDIEPGTRRSRSRGSRAATCTASPNGSTTWPTSASRRSTSTRSSARPRTTATTRTTTTRSTRCSAATTPCASCSTGRTGRACGSSSTACSTTRAAASGRSTTCWRAA